MEAYDMALSYDPGNQDALSGLSGILERRGDWDQLLQIYEARADSGGAEERAFALRGVAAVSEAMISRPVPSKTDTWSPDRSRRTWVI